MTNKFQAFIDQLFDIFFGQKFRHRFEAAILYLGIAGFAAHLLLISLHDLGWINLGGTADELFISPIAAIYTPFSFILIYEVFVWRIDSVALQ
ncbi:MAG: hypothetical protein H6557_24660 [Lewinellaceae bacterium]|nr:hypothetical protein [Phaeodactylibacter sp.]MCB9039824.1 hypothetical protein [Lewinellaceae bacterium]